MSEAYFKVGEECLLASEELPSLNGYVVVIGMVEDDTVGVCPHCGDTVVYKFGDGVVSYYLDQIVTTRCCHPWKQSALRKIHKGSNDSFDSMINKIKDGVTV